jgi:hypothetical protein
LRQGEDGATSKGEKILPANWLLGCASACRSLASSALGGRPFLFAI